jgi:hypothetical protein
MNIREAELLCARRGIGTFLDGAIIHAIPTGYMWAMKARTPNSRILSFDWKSESPIEMQVWPSLNVLVNGLMLIVKDIDSKLEPRAIIEQMEVRELQIRTAYGKLDPTDLFHFLQPESEPGWTVTQDKLETWYFMRCATAREIL